MTLQTLILWAGVPLFTWAGLGCFLGILRFRYWPLAILGTGYLAWVACFLLLLGVGRDPAQHPPLGLMALLFIVGALGIFGYRATFYSRMKARGITPKRLFGFGASA